MSNILDIYYSPNFQKASLGYAGHNVLGSGETSVSGRVYLSITALEDSVISYNKSTQITNDGDASVSSLSVPTGVTLMLGAVEDINVTSGKILANLISIS